MHGALLSLRRTVLKPRLPLDPADTERTDSTRITCRRLPPPAPPPPATASRRLQVTMVLTTDQREIIREASNDGMAWLAKILDLEAHPTAQLASQLTDSPLKVLLLQPGSRRPAIAGMPLPLPAHRRQRPRRHCR